MPAESNDDTAPPGGLRALVEYFPNGVIVLFDEALRYRIVGPDRLPFSRRRAEDLVGNSIEGLFPSPTVETLRPVLRATIEGERRSTDIEYEGRVHHLETRPASIEGEPYGVLVTQEVSVERETERQLREQNERLDQFASMLSHDLRNPVSIAAGRLSLYRETGDESHLDDVEAALERVDELTGDLLTLVRTDAGEIEFESLSLATVAQDAWRSVDTREASLEVTDTSLTGDAGQLRALFENLYRNAVGHGGEDVTVRIGPLDGGFYVEDTGSGIPPDDRERVFEHGYSSGYGGSGIGLTIVGRIADAHDLTIELAESDEGGARFEFHVAAEP